MKTYTFNERAKLCSNAVSKRLFEVMEMKQSNLVFAADVTQTHLLFQLVDKIGPYICAVKTHVDILEDFTIDFGDRLIKLAKQHNFLIFEDRKFADIGHTVSVQYDGGIYRISDWAGIVDAHTIPGSGVIQGLNQVGQPRGRACLLIAEMSSAGNLMTPEYTKATIQMAEEHSDFVIGFICQSKLTSDPKFLHMTPGVHLHDREDNLGQRYRTPFEVINENESDIIIVGRGIIKAEDPVSIAKQYQEAAFSAYRQRLSFICTISKALDILLSAGKLDKSWVMSNSKIQGMAKKTYTFNERAKLCSNAVSRRLFEVMEMKQSNLVFSADVTQTHLLFQLVDKIGPYICAVKTHVDILEDFTIDFGDRLIKLAKQHNFLIFEDRKFAEIGHTVSLQYDGRIYRISDWADIVNAYTIPGSGVIQGLKQVGQPRDRACLLIAEMSSAGNLMTPEYTKATIQMAEEHSDFVIGFICQSKLTSDPKFLHMTPGVHLHDREDNLGQRYRTPFEVINENESDIIIVGRGIIKAEDPVSIAKQYQEAAFSAYRQRLS